MPTSCTHVYVHFVWATWNKAPLIVPELEARIYACIATKCEELKCQLLVIGGTEDHVHALVRVHSTVAVADLAKGMKGSSSHFVTHELAAGRDFKWQGTYGAFSVSPDDLDRICAYIERQKEHHARNTTHSDWERCMTPGEETD
jgi:REP-associated tyrosine transposase